MSDSEPLVNIAAIHEYGAPSRNIKPRPFVSPVIEQCKNEIGEIYQKAIEETFKK